MNKEKILMLAIENHKKGNLEIAKKFYNDVLKIDPIHEQTYNNLGTIFQSLGKYEKAKSCFEKVIQINLNCIEAYFNLGNIYRILEKNQKAKNCFKKVIELNPDYVGAYNNLGNIYRILEKNQKAKNCFKKVIELNPDYVGGYSNLGNIHKILNELQESKSCFEKAIQINPSYVDAHFNLGNILILLGENQQAKKCFERVIEINSNYSPAYWNLYTLSHNIDEALIKLSKFDKVNNNFLPSKIVTSALKAYKGNFNNFNNLLASKDSNHPYTRSVKWVFSLPKLPKIFFNRWDFFDEIIKLAESSRPFYEFGVWNAVSFKYLIGTFKKGFGFDTFSGLPESWGNIKKGTYNSFGSIPKIKGGEFIVGKFEDTLPEFFSKEKPLASLINFDADLYSSTFCALNHSRKVIDDKTILVFDEFIMNTNWEEDEYKALNDFCKNFSFIYEVLAISFASKQVAVKLKKLSS